MVADVVFVDVPAGGFVVEMFVLAVLGDVTAGGLVVLVGVVVAEVVAAEPPVGFGAPEVVGTGVAVVVSVPTGPTAAPGTAMVVSIPEVGSADFDGCCETDEGVLPTTMTPAGVLPSAQALTISRPAMAHTDLLMNF